jgi:DNA-binding transcriptional MerR regulator
MTNDYYTLADVSELLQVPAYRITYLLATRQVPEPGRIGNRRLFTLSDIQRIAEKLEVELMGELSARERGRP